MKEVISREKLSGESFSDAIERLLKRRGALMDAVDSWEDIEEEEIKRIEDNIKKVRKKSSSEVNEKA